MFDEFVTTAGVDLVLLGLSHSHMSFYLRTGGEGVYSDVGLYTCSCRSTYIRVNISRLLILQSLH